MTLQAHHIACVRGGRTLFSNVDLAVAPGDALWVAGANGSGKISLLRILCGLSPPAAGTVHWHGRDIAASRDDYHRDLFYCGHAPGLKDDLPAWRNIDVARRIAGQSGGIDDARRALALFGLEHALHGLLERHLAEGGSIVYTTHQDLALSAGRLHRLDLDGRR